MRRIDNKTVLQGFRTAAGSQDFKDFYKGLQGSRPNSSERRIELRKPI
jgi:hypothetical protein